MRWKPEASLASAVPSPDPTSPTHPTCIDAAQKDLVRKRCPCGSICNVNSLPFRAMRNKSPNCVFKVHIHAGGLIGPRNNDEGERKASLRPMGHGQVATPGWKGKHVLLGSHTAVPGLAS